MVVRKGEAYTPNAATRSRSWSASEADARSRTAQHCGANGTADERVASTGGETVVERQGTTEYENSLAPRGAATPLLASQTQASDHSILESIG